MMMTMMTMMMMVMMVVMMMKENEQVLLFNFELKLCLRYFTLLLESQNVKFGTLLACHF